MLGGITYDKFGLKYTTPTVGLIITPYDYIKFLKNLNYYLSLTPVPYENQPNDKKTNHQPHLYKAHLGDITLNFIHYKTIEDGIAKWERRKKRIVKDNIIVKWSDFKFKDELEEIQMLDEFDKLPYKKFIFTTEPKVADKYDYAYLFPKKDEDDHLILDEFYNSDKIVGFKKIKEVINS